MDKIDVFLGVHGRVPLKLCVNESVKGSFDVINPITDECKYRCLTFRCFDDKEQFKKGKKCRMATFNKEDGKPVMIRIHEQDDLIRSWLSLTDLSKEDEGLTPSVDKPEEKEDYTYPSEQLAGDPKISLFVEPLKHVTTFNNDTSDFRENHDVNRNMP